MLFTYYICFQRELSTLQRLVSTKRSCILRPVIESFQLQVCLKSDSHLLKKKNLFASMKGEILFHLESSFSFFKFFPRLFVHVGKWLDQKDKVNFEIYGVTTWLTNNSSMHIDEYLKCNQAMKLCQLIEYSMKNIFLKIYAKCGGETIPRPFPDQILSKLSIILDKQS